MPFFDVLSALRIKNETKRTSKLLHSKPVNNGAVVFLQMLQGLRVLFPFCEHLRLVKQQLALLVVKLTRLLHTHTNSYWRVLVQKLFECYRNTYSIKSFERARFNKRTVNKNSVVLDKQAPTFTHSFINITLKWMHFFEMDKKINHTMLLNDLILYNYTNSSCHTVCVLQNSSSMFMAIS